MKEEEIFDYKREKEENVLPYITNYGESYKEFMLRCMYEIKAELRKHYSETKEILEKKANFTEGETPEYFDSLVQKWSVLYFGKTYFFEYALMYSVMIRHMLPDIRDYFYNHWEKCNLSVLSLGCGSMVDKAALYQMLRPYSNNIILQNYLGVDAAPWKFNSNVWRNDSLSGTWGGEDGEDVTWGGSYDKKDCHFSEQGICQYLESQAYMPFQYNVMMFPKVLDEIIEAGEQERFLAAVENLNFCSSPYDKFYIAVSHEASSVRKTAELVTEMIKRINKNDNLTKSKTVV